MIKRLKQRLKKADKLERSLGGNRMTLWVKMGISMDTWRKMFNHDHQPTRQPTIDNINAYFDEVGI